MVEFGLVTILLFSLIFFIIEGALAVRARNTVNNAVDDAARRGAIAGRAPTADFQILQQLRGRGVGVNSAGRVERIVVYSSTSGNGGVPTQCLTGSVNNLCNSYVAADLERPAADFGCGSTLDDSWCPTTRGTGGNLGFIGVYVQTTYEPVIGAIFWDEADFSNVEISADAIQAIETSGEQ